MQIALWNNAHTDKLDLLVEGTNVCMYVRSTSCAKVRGRWPGEYLVLNIDYSLAYCCGTDVDLSVLLSVKTVGDWRPALKSLKPVAVAAQCRSVCAVVKQACESVTSAVREH
eukprot:2167486-Pleurochrysis_carterae.AAC.1